MINSSRTNSVQLNDKNNHKTIYKDRMFGKNSKKQIQKFNAFLTFQKKINIFENKNDK